jgi:hypothetical protein
MIQGSDERVLCQIDGMIFEMILSTPSQFLNGKLQVSRG